MRLYPESALSQLEFDKVKALLKEHARTEWAKDKAENLRIHTRKGYIQLELRQTYEYKLILQQNQYFPNDFTYNISRDLKLLSIQGSMRTPRLARNGTSGSQCSSRTLCGVKPVFRASLLSDALPIVTSLIRILPVSLHAVQHDPHALQPHARLELDGRGACHCEIRQ